MLVSCCPVGPTSPATASVMAAFPQDVEVQTSSEATGGIHSVPQCSHVLPEVEDSFHLFLNCAGAEAENPQEADRH